MKNKDPESIYLKIAGFSIKVNLFDEDIIVPESIYNIRRIIENYFSGVTGSNQTTLPDFEIDIHAQGPQIYQKLKNGELLNYLYMYREFSDKIHSFHHISLTHFSYILIRIIQKLLAAGRGFIMHGSAVELNNYAYIFCGKSGAGKSSIINLLPEKYHAIADDTVIIRKAATGYYLYQSPFIEKNENIEKGNKKFRLQKIFILQKSKECSLKRINNKSQAIKLLTRQLYVDYHSKKEQFRHALDLISDFSEFYYLKFSKNKKDLLDLFNRVETASNRQRQH